MTPRFGLLLALCAASTPLVAQQPARQAARLKVFISVDMEGLAGVVTGPNVSSNGPDYPHFRAIMAAETNAAIDGAFRGGPPRCSCATRTAARKTSYRVIWTRAHDSSAA